MTRSTAEARLLKASWSKLPLGKHRETFYDRAVRVIAGIYRSRPLTAPRGLATRPTTDRLRETLFNVIAPRVEGSTFADLYAGSGANGIEALSRGARHVYFVENAAAALAVIRSNLKGLAIGAAYTIEPRAVTAFLHQRAQIHAEDRIGIDRREPATLDLVFFDPPYEDENAYATTLNLLGGQCAAVLSPGALIIAEHRYKQPLQATYSALERQRVLKQGDAALSFYAVSG